MAGCTSISFLVGKLSLSVINHDVERYKLNVELLRRDADNLKEARVFGEPIEVPAATSQRNSATRRNDIVDVRPYIVLVDIFDVRGYIAPYHFHFYPCSTWKREEERIIIHLTPADAVPIQARFEQNGC